MAVPPAQKAPASHSCPSIVVEPDPQKEPAGQPVHSTALLVPPAQKEPEGHSTPAGWADCGGQ